MVFEGVVMRNRVVNEYLKVKDEDVVNMGAVAVAGLYLYQCPEDPETKIVSDMVNCKIPVTLGRSAKVVIDSVLRSEGRCSNVLCSK